MRKRQGQEFANEVIEFYNGVGNRSKKITAKHFAAKSGKERSTVYRIISRYLERGTSDYRKQTGKYRTQTTEENLNKLREILRNDPNTSLRQASNILGIPRTTVATMKAMISQTGTTSRTSKEAAAVLEKQQPQLAMDGGIIAPNSEEVFASFPSAPRKDILIASDRPLKRELSDPPHPPPILAPLHPPIAVKKEVLTGNENDAQLEDYDDFLFSSYFDDDNASAPSPVDQEEHSRDNDDNDNIPSAKKKPKKSELFYWRQQKPKKERSKEKESCDDDNHCLLCHEGMKKNQTPVLTSDIVDANFNAMFILQKMLGLPKSKLAECLESVEDPPGEWVVFCRKCLKLVDEAINIQKEISDLEEKLRGCQRRIFQEIMTSWREKRNKEKGPKKRGRKKKSPPMKSKILGVTENIRRFIRSRESEENEDFEEESFGQGPFETSQRSRRTKGKRKSLREESLSPVDFWDMESSSPQSLIIAEDDPDDFEDNSGSKSVPMNDNGSSESTDTKALTTPGYSCSSCPNMESMNLGTLINHGLFHFRRHLKCYQCGLHFSSSSELKENPFAKKPDSIHICSSETLVQTIFDPGNIWKCSFCSQKFTSDIDRDSHEETCHSENLLQIYLPHKCISCSKQFRSLAERLLHRVLEHPEVASLSCLFCDQTFSSQTLDGTQIPDIASINEHIRKEHDWFPNKKLPEECDFCGAILWTSINLQTHMEQAHGLNKACSYSCTICHIRRTHRPLVTQHYVRVHMMDDPSSQPSQALSCQICGYKTAKEIMLLEHKLTKHGLEPEDGRRVYICTKVGCEFRTLMDLSFTRHLMKDHEEEKKFICRFCGKEFHKTNHRRLHEQIHVNKELRPFQCEMCGKSYAVKTYLYIHKRTAHQNRPFGRTFPKMGKRPRVFGSTSVRIKGGGVESCMETQASSSRRLITKSSDNHGHPQPFTSSGMSIFQTSFDSNMPLPYPYGM